MPSPDDLAALKAERAAADRAYNDALTRLDRAIQQLPADFPQPPPGPDESTIATLNTLWALETAPEGSGWRGRFAAAVRRVVAPVFDRQQAFNAAVVDHINRSVPVARETRESMASTLTVLRDTIAELVRFKSLLVVFLQQITPYVDTRDRDVAGLLRGLSGAINAVADEVLKRSEATLARDRRHDLRVADLESALADVRARLDARVAARRTMPARRGKTFQDRAFSVSDSRRAGEPGSAVWRSLPLRLAIIAIPLWFTVAVLIFHVGWRIKLVIGIVFGVTLAAPAEGLLLVAVLAPLGRLIAEFVDADTFRMGEAIVLAFLVGWVLRGKADRPGPASPRRSIGALFAATVIASIAGLAWQLGQVQGELARLADDLFHSYYLMADRVGLLDGPGSSKVWDWSSRP